MPDLTLAASDVTDDDPLEHGEQPGIPGKEGSDVKRLEAEAMTFTRLAEAGRNVLEEVKRDDQRVKEMQEVERRVAQAHQDVATEAAKLGEIRAETLTETRRRDTMKAEADAQERRLQGFLAELASIKEKVGA